MNVTVNLSDSFVFGGNGRNSCSLLRRERTPAFIQRRFPEASAATAAGHLDSERVRLLQASPDLIILTDVGRRVPGAVKGALVFTDRLRCTTRLRSAQPQFALLEKPVQDLKRGQVSAGLTCAK